MLEQKEKEHSPLSVFFSLETQFCTGCTGRGKSWDPASVTILELCQKSLSCKHTNSPWHWEPCWDLSELCQWQSRSLPAESAPCCLHAGWRLLPWVCAQRAKGLDPRQRWARAGWEICNRGGYVIQIHTMLSHRKGWIWGPRLGDGLRLWIIIWHRQALKSQLEVWQSSDQLGFRACPCHISLTSFLARVLVLAPTLIPQKQDSLMHSFAKLNKCADLGLVFNSHSNKKLLFSPSCKSTFYALFWVHLFNVKSSAIKQLTGRDLSSSVAFCKDEIWRNGLQHLSIQLGIVTSQKTNHLGKRELYEFPKPIKLLPAVLSKARNYLTAFTADANVTKLKTPHFERLTTIKT